MPAPRLKAAKLITAALFLLLAAALIWKATRARGPEVDPAVQQRAMQIESELQPAAPDESAAPAPPDPSSPVGRRPHAPR